MNLMDTAIMLQSEDDLGELHVWFETLTLEEKKILWIQFVEATLEILDQLAEGFSEMS